MFKVKAKNTILIAQDLINKFNGVVPNDKEKLMTLPGVGNKTAGVILAELFNNPELPVDTHVSRVSKRLGLVKEKDEPITIENKLKKLIDKKRWVKSHHQFIHFGRYFCLARSPKCSTCKLKEICKTKS
jgi:endonuclease-3